MYNALALIADWRTQVEITVNLIKTAMMNSGASLFLIDGFPRNFDNLQGWHKVMGDDVR